MSQGLTLSILRLQEAWGPGGHQVINIFLLVGVLAPVKKLRKYGSDTIILVLQRGAKAEHMGEGSVPGRPHRVLLCHTGLVSQCPHLGK